MAGRLVAGKERVVREVGLDQPGAAGLPCAGQQDSLAWPSRPSLALASPQHWPHLELHWCGQCYGARRGRNWRPVVLRPLYLIISH